MTTFGLAKVVNFVEETLLFVDKICRAADFSLLL